VQLIAITVLLAVLLVACGGTANQGTATTAANQGTNNAQNDNNAGNMNNGTPMTNATPMTNETPMANATPMTNGTPMANATPMTNENPMDDGMPMDQGNMMNPITITPSMAGNMNAFIHTGKVTIKGNTVDVLLTNKNFAVYYYKPDTKFKATCTGECAKDWPPVLAPKGMMTVNSSVPLPKQLSVRQTANGAQVFYDGHALYTYAEDKQAANATGRGDEMKWYLVGTLL